jgi:DNA adenine methylase
MSAYQGGKKRLGKRIYTIIKYIENDFADQRGSTECLPYFEPFIGMASIMKHFAEESNCRELYASDANKDLILLWQAIQKGWQPPLHCSLKEYNTLKDSKSSAKRGFIGIAASYGAIFFSGYRLNYNKNKNYLKEASDGLLSIAKSMKKVDFIGAHSYNEWAPKGYLIYCDPPYLNNKLKTPYFQGFDHKLFWETMRKWSKNNIVIISEVTAPKDFIKIWSAQSTCNNFEHINKNYVDSLFMHNSLWNKVNKSTKKCIKLEQF